MTDPAKRNFNRLDYLFKFSVVLALLITAIILASDIIIPLAFAGLLSIVMLPLVRKLEARGLGTALSSSLVLLVTVVCLVLLAWITVNQVVALANDLPSLEAKLESFVSSVQTTLLQDFGISAVKQTEMFSEVMKSASMYLGNVLVSTTHTVSTIVQIPIYIFLILIYRDKFKLFLLRLLPASSTEHRWKKDIERVTQGYISGLFLVTLIAAFLNTVGLLIVGIDHAIFFGILSGVLTVIPYVGIIIGSLFPIVMALITKDSVWYAVGVVMVFSIVQFLEGNFISPRVTGSKVSINALAAIVALLLGGKILGIAGMILSIPTIGILKIVLEYSPRLSPFIILLEDRAPEPVAPPVKTKAEKEMDDILPSEPTVSQ